MSKTVIMKTELFIDGQIQTNKKWKTKLKPKNLQINEQTESVDEIRETKSESPILTLNIDCFREIFHYLSHRDLDAIGQSCRQLQSIAGAYFFRYFPSLVSHANDFKHMQLNSINRYINNVYFNADVLQDYRFIQNYCHQFPQQIHFTGQPLTIRVIESTKKLLINVESLRFSYCKISKRALKRLSAICSNLERLELVSNEISGKVRKRNDYNWLLQIHPRLEHLKFITLHHVEQIDEIKTFFQRNPRVRSFSTDGQFLWLNRHSIIESTVKLDNLTIELVDMDFRNEHFRRIFELIDELYRRSVYKRLHLKIGEINQEIVNRMAAVHCLKSIECISFDVGNDLTSLTELKGLKIGEIKNENSVDFLTSRESVAKYPSNIKQIDLNVTDTRFVLPFVYYFKKLTQMKISSMKDENDTIFDLATMNKQRMKLDRPCRLTIYAPGPNYLATKWKYQTTGYSFIDLRRVESCKRQYDSDWF